jgi:hypothetical protein
MNVPVSVVGFLQSRGFAPAPDGAFPIDEIRTSG